MAIADNAVEREWRPIYMRDTLINEMHQTGYDLEEEYFHRVNAELIERWRRHAGYRAPSLATDAERYMHVEHYDTPGLKAVVQRVLHELVKPLPSGIGQFPV
jgi:hypothetical protein